MKIDDDGILGAGDGGEMQAAPKGTLRRERGLEDIPRRVAGHRRGFARVMRPELSGARMGPGNAHLVRSGG